MGIMLHRIGLLEQGGGGGGGGTPLAFDFTSNRKMLYPFLNSQVHGSSNDGWAFYADFTYDGGADRYLLYIATSEALSVSFHNGKVRVSDFSVFQTGSTTFSSGRHRVSCRYDGITLKVWVKPDGGSRTEEINAAVSYTATRSAGQWAQIGGAFNDAGNSGLSARPLMGKMYAGAFWKTPPTEADILALIDGNIEIGGVTQAPTWWPDPNDSGRDQTSGVLTVKTFNEARQLTAPATIDNSRVMRDPETGAPVTYDAGSGAVYWMAYGDLSGNLYLATSSDLETWTNDSQLFSGEGNSLRPSDFLYLGNIAGGHDPFLLLTCSTISTESMIHARTSSDMATWSYPTINAANAIFRDTSINSGGVEDFVVCRYNSAWYAAYEQDGLQDGTVAVGIAKSTATLPSSGWSVVNSRAFTTPDAGYNTSQRFVANPVCIAKDGAFWLFYEGADFDGSTRTLPTTLMRKTTNPESQVAWEDHGVVFYSLGRKCFPNSITIEGGEIALYLQNGPGALSSDGTALGKVEYDDLSFLLVP